MHSTSIISLALAAGAAATGVWTTPHDSYSSSVGVLGCKINTNRVAYWPGSISCNNICIKLSHAGRSVHLLRIDQSGGAYDISYDAWAYLQTGQPAAANPIAGGTVAMEYEEVDASACADLILTPGHKLPLSASNSMNYLVSCLAEPNSYVAKNHVLYNIADAICTMGFDEECHLDLSVSNQASCPHTLGLTTKLTSVPVFNIAYQTGKTTVAGTGEVVSPDAAKAVAAPEPNEDAVGSNSPSPDPAPAAQPTATGGVFREEVSSEAPAPAASTTTSTTTSAALVAAATTTSAAPTSSTSATRIAETVTSSTTVLPPVGSYNQTGTGHQSSKPSVIVQTSMSVVTVPGSRSTPSGSASTVPSINAGHAPGASVLALASSILLCSAWALL